ncbi:response regulator transcription factor [Novosphingobium resinovorum]|uniref:DNA-binding response regulator n=1 Tax=Novosphingobium resinovorum TaxID=158500 RepID=A0A031JQT8_9SPHN|nr:MULTISPECIES: response regulator transcription factor [Novosphingobium]AOR79642.1 DNA-binding response regulator [Novosphingobium resinovorum]EZP79259.1 Two-component transcriptional regulator involved in heavy-metal (Cu/Zn) homeostasis [Novosphingobium resinovorum]MBF7013409.1 response regulator transcription factor [Novosphingobium sp. HR1a]WJM25560.1 response regulator transcription factor [Novosphingobium resinovorum]
MRLLVIEDDDRGASYLVRGLQESGHVVDRAQEGETGLMLATEGFYDVAVIDRMLPRMDGIAIVQAMRKAGNDTPVLMLSALSGALDKAEGIRAGCDDYLAKPYAFAELSARIEALARRADRARSNAVLKVGDLSFDPASRRAVRGAVDVVLQHKESLLLEFLMRNAGRIVTRTMLIEAAWDYDFEPIDALIDRHIHRLRRKIDRDPPEQLIQTVHGAGYRMAAPIL